MVLETKERLNAAEIKAIIKAMLPPENEIREMIGNYSNLMEKERLMIDSYYFTRAANVTDDEANMFYFYLQKGARVHPEIIDSEHPVFCPVHRMRLALLGEKAKKLYRYIVWGNKS